RHFCVVSYSVGEIHLPAHPGAARVKQHLYQHPSGVWRARPGAADQRRRRMVLAKGMLSKERDPFCSFLVLTVPEMEQGEFLRSSTEELPLKNGEIH
ncbi:hypothetical protein HGM15179_018013, partial [Zosterops borbonicus]